MVLERESVYVTSLAERLLDKSASPRPTHQNHALPSASSHVEPLLCSPARQKGDPSAFSTPLALPCCCYPRFYRLHRA